MNVTHTQPTTQPFRPQADSLAQRVCHFLANNLEEELTLDDICIKFDTGRGNIHTQLTKAKDAGFLLREKNADDEYVYKAGPKISCIDTPASEIAPGVKKTIADIANGKQRRKPNRPPVTLPMPDLDNIEIDNDPTLLEAKRRDIKYDFTTKLRSLLVAQSFKLDSKFVHVVTSQISKLHKQGEARYRCITIDGQTIRVGRVA